MSAQTEYITKGSSSFTVIVNLLQDNSGSNPGDPLTGITSTASGLVCYHKTGATGAVTSLSLATLASTDAFSLGGFAQLSSANMPGAFRLDLSTTLFSSGDNFGQVLISGYVDLAAHSIHIKFTDFDLYSSMQTELATYGPSTHTSTDVDDSLNTYGASTHTTTDITDAITNYGASTLGTTNLTDAHNTYGASTHTSTDIDDSLATYGVSTHTSTDLTDVLTSYGASTLTTTDLTDLNASTLGTTHLTQALTDYSPSTHTTTDINDQVKDVLFTDTLTLPGQTAISNTPTIAEALAWLLKKNRNKMDNEGSTTQLYDDAGTTVDQKQTTTVSSGVVTKAEWVTGP